MEPTWFLSASLAADLSLMAYPGEYAMAGAWPVRRLYTGCGKWAGLFNPHQDSPPWNRDDCVHKPFISISGELSSLLC
jgi:hypothetical protein